MDIESILCPLCEKNVESDEHVGFTLPILDILLSKGLRTVKSTPLKCRLGFSLVLKGALDKVMCTPDDISCWEESIANAIRSWGNPGGSLQLVKEALAEHSPSWSNIDEENLNVGERNVKQCKREICDGHYTTTIRVLSSSGVAPYNDATLEDLKAKHPLKPAPSLPHIPIDYHQLAASLAAVLDMIKSFLRGTSCGRDGLHAQHLMDCLSGVVVAISDELVSSITQVVNLFLDGKYPNTLVRGDGVAGIKRRRRDLFGDGVRNLATASGRGRLKEDLIIYVATASGFQSDAVLAIGLNVFQQDPSPHRRILLLVSLLNSFHRKGPQNFAMISSPHHGIDLWLRVQIFYDLIDHTLKRTVDYAAGGRLRKMSVEKAWATIEELARYEDEGWNDLVAPGEGSLDYKNPNIEQLLGVIECKVDTLMKEAISLMGRSESVFGMTSNTVYQLPSEPSRQEEFEDLVMNFILDQEEKVRQLEEYMCVIASDFMQLFLEVIRKLREEIRIEQNRTKKIKKITRESTFGFKPGTKNNRNIKSRHDAENLSPQSSPQVLPSFEVYTPPVTYPKEVKETLGTPIEVESLDETQLEDLGLNICNHDIPLSSREVSSFDEPEPQPNPLPNYPSLDVRLGKERSSEPSNKPYSPDGFRMKEVDHLTIHAPPSPHMASFHPKDTYCYYHPFIDDPKKHYGFKPGLLGQSGSLGVDFSNLEMVENDWELESKEAYFLGRGLNSPVRPKEVEKVKIKETHHLEHII
ncbi:hypothetical protein Tco_0991087 [Tanacetum coccineum]|uniref:FRIGIDA-like protein n=1 Tax=Tanacetum coccineum TaxID=301880 RepID=A0ABQ5EZ17_9ASTR